MKVFELEKIKNCDALIKQTPTKEHYNKVISEDTVFTKNGKKVGIYIKIKHPLISEIRKATIETKFVKTYRNPVVISDLTLNVLLKIKGNHQQLINNKFSIACVK